MRRIVLCTAVLFSISFLSVALAQDEQKNQAEQMKLWEEYMTPSSFHKDMAKMEGKWKVHTKYWMDPSQAPMESDGTAEFQMILGGRYLKSETKSTMNNMPFEGFELEGYDNAKKVITAVWVDNFGTGTMVMNGTYDGEKNLITLSGSSYDPMSGKDLNFKQLVSTSDENKVHMEMYLVSDKGDVKVMEADYNRE